MHHPITFTDPDVQRCPFLAYDELREKGPVYWDEESQGYIVLGYDEIRAAANDAETFSNVTGRLLVMENSPYQDEVDAIYRNEGLMPINTLVASDPPEHTFYRSLVNKVFTPARVKSMDGYIRQVINDLVDGIIDAGEIEFCATLSARIPSYIMADQMGLPRNDFEKFRRWSEAAARETGLGNSREEQLEITRAICEMQRYLLKKNEEYRSSPQDNLLTALVNARSDDGMQLSDRELVSIGQQLLAGGNGTTVRAMTSAMYHLARTPGMEEVLRSDPKNLERFIEEILRLCSPTQGLWRRVTKATELGGVKLKQGDLVVLRFGAGNHDPAIFPNPHEISLDRPNIRNHLAFGSGIHFCVGVNLARAQLKAGFDIYLDRMKNFRLARGEEGVKFITSYRSYGMSHLELAFDRNSHG